MKKIVGKIFGMTLAGAMLLGATASAEEVLLGKVDFTADKKELKAELWGEQLHSGYNRQLVLLIKNAEGKLVTAYNPDIKGGYGCKLVTVKAGKKGEQLLLGVAQGDWRSASEYRILDVSKPKAVKEIFSSKESMGIVSYAECKGNELELRTINGDSSVMPLNPGVKEHLGRRTDFGGVYSLLPYDADEDGVDELLLSQKISSGSTQVADVGAIMKLDDKQKWKPLGITLMATPAPDKSNTVNDGREFAAGTIVPQRIVIPGGEATFPSFLDNTRLDVQAQFNKTLEEECASYLKSFYNGDADMAFNIVTADSDLVSIRLISGKDSFKHHHVNIDPATGKLIKIDQVLDTKNPDLIPLLELLTSNKNVIFEELPQEWYIEGENLFFIQNVCGKDECTGYNLANLHKYLLDKKWLSRKAH